MLDRSSFVPWTAMHFISIVANISVYSCTTWVLGLETRKAEGLETRTLEPAAEQRCAQFIVTPNCSMSWRANKIVVASLAVISFGIAGIFALQGLWVILPFVGFEIAFLTLVLYWCCLRTSRCEVISIDADTIQIEVGRKRAQQLHTFQRAWTRVLCKPPTRAGERGCLVMRSKGVELEIGSCLSERERQDLAASIQQTLAKFAG